MNQVKPIIVQQGLGKFNPYRRKCGSWMIYSALAKTKKPLLFADIAKLSKVPLEKTKEIIGHFRHAKHGLPIHRKGIALVGDFRSGFVLKKMKRKDIPDKKLRSGNGVCPIVVQSIAPAGNTSAAWGQGWHIGFYSRETDVVKCPYPSDTKDGIELAKAWQKGLYDGVDAQDQYSEWLNGQEDVEEEQAEAA